MNPTRIRSLGIPVGTLKPGRIQKIPDVPGVRVGHGTLDSTRRKTDVTVVRASVPKRIGMRKSASAVILAVALFLGQVCGGTPVLTVRGEETPLPCSEDRVWSRLVHSLLACAETVDLTDCAITPSALGAVYVRVLQAHPELFHVAPRLSYGYREVIIDGEPVRAVTELHPVYTLTGEALTAARILYRDAVSGILTEMEAAFGDSPRTEAETVLWLHDRLADRYAYDTREGEMNADAYTFFRDGTGICQAYALAFIALCRGAGLEADFVSSTSMDHAWNHVRVDGVWYHVDVTRDDPIPAADGTEEVNHLRLLRSDAGMNALGYRDYHCSAGHTCTDTRYEPEGQAVLAAFSAPLEVWGGGWLGMAENGGVAAVRVQNGGIHIGEVGDLDWNGVVNPADLLVMYHPDLPEAWRAWMRVKLIKGI